MDEGVEVKRIGNKVLKYYKSSLDPLAEMYDDHVKVEWAHAGEGYSGDYNPWDSTDKQLLRFYVSVFDGGEWVEVEDASYCTTVSLDLPQNVIEATLQFLFERFSDALQDWPYTSVKKLGEELSWIDPNAFA